MTTSAYQQADYKTNIDQTDRHLHVTSGNKTIKTEEQSDSLNVSRILLEEMLVQMKITNNLLAEMLGDKITELEIHE